ncbi:MAG: hypothetical protein Q7T16_01140 [Candidatus Burarchaeum sp.]|nr:hypothetical protein [Candidatus Burarchaeum sp.]MDO8339241.1 hypothetical protein [Candidatus Burarchaeum sp.]
MNAVTTLLVLLAVAALAGCGALGSGASPEATAQAPMQAEGTPQQPARPGIDELAPGEGTGAGDLAAAGADDVPPSGGTGSGGTTAAEDGSGQQQEQPGTLEDEEGGVGADMTPPPFPEG